MIRRYEGKEFKLFNLANYLGETEDLSGNYPSLVVSLKLKLENWLKDTHANMPVAKK